MDLNITYVNHNLYYGHVTQATHNNVLKTVRFQGVIKSENFRGYYAGSFEPEICTFLDGHPLASPSEEATPLSRRLSLSQSGKDEAEIFLATSLEPEGAHLVFPCLEWQKYLITLTVENVPKEYQVFSCSDPEITDQGETRTWKFKSTIPIYPSSLGWVIGNFLVNSPGPVTVVYPQKYENRAEMMSEICGKIFPMLTEYFRTKLPGQVRIVLLPQHRGLGQENFMCLTIFAGVENELRLGRLLAHELTHMWMGNISAPKNLQTYWIKEGVARVLEFKIVSEIFCEEISDLREIWRKDVVEEAAIEELAGNTEISSCDFRLNAVVYGKGAAIMSMINIFVGVEKFRAGLNELVEQYPCFDLESVKTVFGQIAWVDDWVNTKGPVILYVDVLDDVIILKHKTTRSFPLEILLDDRITVFFVDERVKFFTFNHNIELLAINPYFNSYIVPVYSITAANKVPQSILQPQVDFFDRIKYFCSSFCSFHTLWERPPQVWLQWTLPLHKTI